MSLIKPSKKFPSPISENRYSRNAGNPSALAMRRVSNAFNSVLQLQRKQHYAWGYSVRSTAVGVAGTTGENYFLIRTGPSSSEIHAWIAMAPTDNSSSGGDPSARLVISQGSPRYGNFAINSNYTSTGDYAPSDVNWCLSKIDELEPDTVYLCWIERYNYGRYQSVGVFEEAAPLLDSDDVEVSPTSEFEVESPITAGKLLALRDAGEELWKKAGSTLVAFSGVDFNPFSPTEIDSATWTNIVDLSTSGYSATSMGYRVNLENHERGNRDVGVQLAVYAFRTAGSAALDLRVRSASGTVFSESGISSPETILTSDHSVPAVNSKWDIEARTTAGTTWEIYAVSVWEYE